MSENRDEATGQFTPAEPSEPLTGRAGIEAAAGYEPYEPPATEMPAEGTTPITVEEAAQELTASRTSENDIVTHSALDGWLDELPENVTLTIEQAAELTTDAKEAEAKAAEENEAAKLRAEVDKLRGTQPDDPIDSVEGLEEETKRALKIPQVAQAIEQEFVRADQVRDNYSTALNSAHQFGQAAVLAVVPELEGVPLHQWQQGLEILSQVDPARAQTAATMLNRVATLQQAQQQEQAQRAYASQQQFEQFGKAEDAKFRQMLGNDSGKIKEAGTDVVSYLSELGIGQDRLVHLLRTDPTIRSAEGQRILTDAAKYHKIMHSAKPTPTKQVPHVRRPGISQPSRGNDQSSKIQALERQLSTATGERAARISAEIHGLERQAANR